MESSNDIKFIIDETLDFDPFCPLDDTYCCYRQEGRESVTCPLEVRDKSMAQAVDLNILLKENDGRAEESASQCSALIPVNLEEVMKEANLLAMQLEKCQLLEKKNIGSETKFETVLEPELLPPIMFLCAETEAPKKARRKTYNVKNSPMQALLPTVEPDNCLAQGSPKAPFSEGRIPSPCLVDLPSPRRLQNTSYVCRPDVPQAKLSEPKALRTMTSGSKKLQATVRNNRAEKKHVLPTTTKGQQPSVHVKPLPQSGIRKLQRRTEASAKNNPDQGPQVSSSQGTVLAAQVKGKPSSQMSFRRTSPVKKTLVAPEKMAPPQKTNASQVKTMGSNVPKRQATYKPRGGSGQIQTRQTPSQLPVPTNHTAADSGRCKVPGKSSQFKPVSTETSGGQRSTKPVAGIGKKAASQKPIPPGTFQNSRLRPPKSSSNSK